MYEPRESFRTLTGKTGVGGRHHGGLVEGVRRFQAVSAKHASAKAAQISPTHPETAQSVEETLRSLVADDRYRAEGPDGVRSARR